MAYPFSYLQLPGFDINVAQSPQAPRPDPVNDRYAYVTYEDHASHPGILSIAEIDLQTQIVSRHSSIAVTDSEGSIALPFSQDAIVLWAAVNGAASQRFWQLKKSDFSILKQSSTFVPPPLSGSLSVDDGNMAVSDDGQWAIVNGGYDGTLGQYIEIWHVTTNILYGAYLSGLVAVPNAIQSMGFDGSNNLYMAIGVTGKFYKFSLAESGGVITPTLLNTFTLPQADERVWAITYRPSVNKFTLWAQSPHATSATPLLLWFWDIGTDTIDGTSYSINTGTNNLGAGIDIFDKWGATERTTFIGVFGSSVSLPDCFFGVIDITSGTLTTYLISLWDATGNIFGGNDPPDTWAAYSASNNTIYVTQNGVSFGPPDLHSIIFSFPSPTKAAYYIERMDDRIWPTIEDAWCLDAALAYPMPEPAATLTPGAATGTTTFVASAGVFTSSDVGSVIRVGGGKATVTIYNSSTSVTGQLISPITETYPNDPFNTPIPATAGNWTLTVPTMTVSGLDHLEGLTVAALADGAVVSPLTVVAGTVTLTTAATAITVGLPFTAQLQTLYLEAEGANTLQSKRKNVVRATLRVQNSVPPQIGTNQPDSSVQPNQATVAWGASPYASLSQITSTVTTGVQPLYSGDFQITNVFDNWGTNGQIAVQQSNPVPLTVLALVPWVQPGDDE